MTTLATLVDYKDGMKEIIQKPMLKWVGGKTQLIPDIIKKLPLSINNYHEIFLGGGSVLFMILSLRNHNIIHISNKIYAYDLNEKLINFDFIPEELKNKIINFWIEYNSN